MSHGLIPPFAGRVVGCGRRDSIRVTHPHQTPIIEISSLVKRYGDFTAVDAIDMSVDRGEIFGILGPNGAGKTTTLEMIEGLRAPDSGTIQVLGVSPWPRNASLLPRIGVQLQ